MVAAPVVHKFFLNEPFHLCPPCTILHFRCRQTVNGALKHASLTVCVETRIPAYSFRVCQSGGSKINLTLSWFKRKQLATVHAPPLSRLQVVCFTNVLPANTVQKELYLTMFPLNCFLGVRKAQSSLPLQLLIFFGGWFAVAFAIVNVCVFVYKGMSLPYPKLTFDIEFCMSFLFIAVEPIRLFLGSKGNKSEQVGPLAFSAILSVPVMAFHIYLVVYQTYVLRIDQIISGISLGFCCGQVLLSIAAILTFIRGSRST